MAQVNKRPTSSLGYELDMDSEQGKFTQPPFSGPSLSGSAFLERKNQLSRYNTGGAPIGNDLHTSMSAANFDGNTVAGSSNMLIPESGRKATSTSRDIQPANEIRHTIESTPQLYQTGKLAEIEQPVLANGHNHVQIDRLDSHNHSRESPINDKEDNGEEGYSSDDLFEVTFGKQAGRRAVSVMSSDDAGSDTGDGRRCKPKTTSSKPGSKPTLKPGLKPNFKSGPKPSSSKPPTKPAAIDPTNKDGKVNAFDPSEHNSHCEPLAHSPSTPPPPTTTEKGLQISRVLLSVHKFHTRAIHLIPNFPLPAERYWVGILHLNKDLRTMRSERDLLWLKGNRSTTVHTLVHHYATYTARPLAAIQLRLGGVGAVNHDDLLCELDLLGAKKVFFWAVEVVVPAVDEAEAVEAPRELAQLAPASRHAAPEPWGVTKGLVPARLMQEEDVIDLDG